MIESKEPDLLPPAPLVIVPQLYTYNDVSRALRVTKQTLMEWVKTGKVSSPKYFGFTARFTSEQMAEMMAGPKPAGTHQVAESPRSKIQKPADLVPSAAELNKKAMALDAQAVHTARTKERKKDAAKKTAAKKKAAPKKTAGKKNK